MEKKSYYEQTGVAMTCRSYSEYVSMFALNGEVLKGKRVLDVAGGASSFTAEARIKGLKSEAVDPLYVKTAEEIAEYGRQEIMTSTAKLANLKHLYKWDYYGSLENHQANRENSLVQFLQDYASEGASDRYHVGKLPELPFDKDTFSLVLCSHFLFLYEDQFNFAFHLSAIKELLRVCKSGGEVRIYPILNFRTEQYSGMEKLVKALEEEGHDVDFLESKLPFMPNSDRLLAVRKQP